MAKLMAGPTYEAAQAQMQTDQASQARWQPFIETTSFKFIISAFNSTVDSKRQWEIMESFAFMGYRGPISLKNPDIGISVDERWPNPNSTGVHDTHPDRRLGVWLGRRVRQAEIRG